MEDADASRRSICLAGLPMRMELDGRYSGSIFFCMVVIERVEICCFDIRESFSRHGLEFFFFLVLAPRACRRCRL